MCAVWYDVFSIPKRPQRSQLTYLMMANPELGTCLAGTGWVPSVRKNHAVGESRIDVFSAPILQYAEEETSQLDWIRDEVIAGQAPHCGSFREGRRLITGKARENFAREVAFSRALKDEKGFN